MLDKSDHLVHPDGRVQGVEHLLALRLIEQRQSGKPLAEAGCVHGHIPVDVDPG